MTLIHMALLWFLPLVLLPVILHLITLHRVKNIDLSTYRFLFDSYMRQRSHMKFMEALLSALRTLFLLLLLFLVARPVMKHWNALFRTDAGRDKILLVDCSASMNARTDGVSALERAKTAILSLAAKMNREDRLTLIRVAGAPEEVFRRLSPDNETLQGKVEGLAITPSRANFLAAFRQVFGVRNTLDSLPAVFLFTDGQNNSWKEAREQGLASLLPDGTRLTLVNVGSETPQPNRAVTGNAPPPQLAIVGLPVILKPRVINASAQENADLMVNVFMNDQEVGRVSCALKPGEEAVKEFIYVPKEAGILRGRFEIPFDRFPDDNSFLFVLNVMPQVKVLLVNGKPSPDPLDDEAIYLRTALTTEADFDGRKGGLQAMLPGRDFMRSLEVREIAEPGVNPEVLKDTSVVILANCGQLLESQYGWLRDFVGKGGGLIVFPGEYVNPDLYNDKFFPRPGPQEERLTSIRLEKPRGELRQAKTFERFTALDFEHPVLAVFSDPAQHYFNTASFYRRFPLSSIKGRGNAWAMARFADNLPALVESRFGDGIVLIAAFPANARWSNLPLKPEFVPLILRMVSHAQHRPELEAPSVALAEGSAEIALAADWAPASGTVSDLTGKKTPLAFQRAGTRLVGSFERAVEKGYYTIDIQGGNRNLPKHGTAVVAVNVAPEESESRLSTKEELQQLMPSAQLALVDASSEAQQMYGSLGDEREVWRPLIFLLFIVIGAEFMLATWTGDRNAGPKRRLSDRLREKLAALWGRPGET